MVAVSRTSDPAGADRDPSQTSTKSPGSRLLHTVDQVAARPRFAVAVVGLSVVWVIFSAIIGFPTQLETIFQTFVAALTLAMLFVIQHTQARQQAVTQRKLDELLRAEPTADNRVITLEDASDTELRHVTRRHRTLRAAARAEVGDNNA